MTCVIADMGFSMKIRGSKVIKNGVEEHAEDGSLRDVSDSYVESLDLSVGLIHPNCSVDMLSVRRPL